jgi:hypothetical protein
MRRCVLVLSDYGSYYFAGGALLVKAVLSSIYLRLGWAQMTKKVPMALDSAN